MPGDPGVSTDSIAAFIQSQLGSTHSIRGVERVTADSVAGNYVIYISFSLARWRGCHSNLIAPFPKRTVAGLSATKDLSHIRSRRLGEFDLKVRLRVSCDFHFKSNRGINKTAQILNTND